MHIVIIIWNGIFFSCSVYSHIWEIEKNCKKLQRPIYFPTVTSIMGSHLWPNCSFHMGKDPLPFLSHAHSNAHTGAACTATATTVSAQTWGCKCYRHLLRGTAHPLTSYLLYFSCSGLAVEADRSMTLLYRKPVVHLQVRLSHLHVLRETPRAQQRKG